MYAVTVSDGFCTAIDSADIILVSSLLDNKPPLAVPADTVICQQELPYLLYPSSDFTDEFFLNQNPAGQLPVKLDSEGEYLISVMVEGCLFSDTFSLKTNDCEAAVYLPNVFSPNGDGINDLFFPQGKNFTSVKLSIYDRWGGRLKMMEGPSVHWDGKGAGEGVYVYVFEYLNVFTNEKENIVGAVTLLR
jgi:gliding motility-associated-like protein